MADLYVYFYELGLQLLKPGGLLSFIVTNKWMKAGYGEPLRRFFAEAGLDRIGRGLRPRQADLRGRRRVSVDHRGPQADDGPKPNDRAICTIPREQLRIDDLQPADRDEGVEIAVAQLSGRLGNLSRAASTTCWQKIRSDRLPLQSSWAQGLLWASRLACNEAFLINGRRERLGQGDPRCAEVLRPYLRGQDLTRWYAELGGLWMIAMKSSRGLSWPWAIAELCRSSFPNSIHLANLRRSLQTHRPERLEG